MLATSLFGLFALLAGGAAFKVSYELDDRWEKGFLSAFFVRISSFFRSNFIVLLFEFIVLLFEFHRFFP
jgi:hypothetical protein